MEDDVNPPPEKRIRQSKSERRKRRGQNKSRPSTFKPDREAELCNTLINTAENEEPKRCERINCKFMHNVAEYLKQKPEDIGEFFAFLFV